jgi:hypothetical protein
MSVGEPQSGFISSLRYEEQIYNAAMKPLRVEVVPSILWIYRYSFVIPWSDCIRISMGKLGHRGYDGGGCATILMAMAKMQKI